jgi:hypothetical protein
MEYTIERPNGTAATASFQESEMIEAATPRWSGADDLPDGTEFAVLEFGGVAFKVYRVVEAVA